jgi:uncharacterized membrane protein
MAKKTQKQKSLSELKAEKKAEVLGRDKKSSKSMGAIMGVVVVAVVMAAGVWLVNPGGILNGGGQDAQTVASTSAKTEVSLDAAQFADGKVRHFAYMSPEGIKVRYFVLKSSDGVIRAAFDACDVCWRANKGYSQDGDVMICNNCGRRFASVRVNEVKGGCNPAPLVRNVADGKVIIKVADILEGRRFFNFGS